MNASLHRQLNRRKRRILRRIENQPGVERHQPMMTASNIHYEIADRTRAISPGGIDWCDQENLVAQLKGGVKALAMPVNDLVSNWAYMVMASLAWSLKAWSALVLPEQGRWAEKYWAEKRSLLRMEFSTFCVAMIQVPCQIVRTSRRIVYRLLAWNPWQGVFLRLVERLHGRRLC